MENAEDSENYPVFNLCGQIPHQKEEITSVFMHVCIVCMLVLCILICVLNWSVYIVLLNKQ